jgi:putative pyruvate formate lyase activating enzyme
MIRHLIMPNNLDETENILQWIGQNLPKDTYVNVMKQYRPVYKAFEYPEISRRITIAEYKRAEEAAKRAGLTNYKIQG